MGLRCSIWRHESLHVNSPYCVGRTAMHQVERFRPNKMHDSATSIVQPQVRTGCIAAANSAFSSSVSGPKGMRQAPTGVP